MAELFSSLASSFGSPASGEGGVCCRVWRGGCCAGRNQDGYQVARLVVAGKPGSDGHDSASVLFHVGPLPHRGLMKLGTLRHEITLLNPPSTLLGDVWANVEG